MRKRKLWIPLLLAVWIPGVLLHLLSAEAQTNPLKEATMESETVSEPFEDVLIRILHNDCVLTMPLEEYLCGVLLGEIPASFHEEALKAQAVAARTYTLKKLKNSDAHIGADLCTDSTCCQAYAESDNIDAVQKIRNAVDMTAGKVLIYDSDLIEATYFSCSGGRTEAAVAVWGTDVPYLQALDSPWETDAKYYRNTVVFEELELLDRLGFSETVQAFSYSDIKYTDGYGVESIIICGKQFTGKQLRKLLNLRSTAFTIEQNEGRISFTTRGYGHRVGMSQYGAEAMAQQGSKYEEILAYYYPKTQLITLDASQQRRLFDKEGNL